MWLGPDQRQVVMVGILVFDAKLAIWVWVPVDHLRVVVVSLGLNLVLCKNVGGLSSHLLSSFNSYHHISLVTVLKRLKLVLPGRYDSFFRVTRAHIVVLETLCTSDTIGCVTLHLLGSRQLTHSADMLLIGNILDLITLRQHLLVGVIGVQCLLVDIKGYLNAPIGIPYCFWNRLLLQTDQLLLLFFKVDLRKV